MTHPGPISLVSIVLVLLLSPASSETSALQDLISRNADFGARLYRVLAARTDENVLLCPFTLSAALTVLLSATNGQTREQLQAGLTLTRLDAQTLPGGFKVKGHQSLVVVQVLSGAPVFRCVSDSEERHSDSLSAAGCSHLPLSECPSGLVLPEPGSDQARRHSSGCGLHKCLRSHQHHQPLGAGADCRPGPGFHFRSRPSDPAAARRRYSLQRYVSSARGQDLEC